MASFSCSTKCLFIYDPMIAKLITWGTTREDCIHRLQRALAEYMLTGIKSNIVLHKNIFVHPTFFDGSYTTQFIDQQVAGKKQRELFMFVDEHVFLIAAAITAYKRQQERRDFRIQPRQPMAQSRPTEPAEDLSMYFEAESDGRKYENERDRNQNPLEGGPQGGPSADWIHYDIPKSDYTLSTKPCLFFLKTAPTWST